MAEIKQNENAVSTNELENEKSSEFLEVSRHKLRQRWELASVLNFLSVFEPVIGKDLKMSGEEIENALITPNDSLAKLHVTLLKGIPPVSKNLSSPDAWVTSLCKKLAEWWPWVAEGDVPLIAAKGEEIPRYKELDPTIRLLMLKALCELRSEQDDLVSYVNDALKEGTQLSHFRKDKIGEDRTGVSYWYDGNSVIGHRLYREVNKSKSKPKHNGKGCLDWPSPNVKWETLATNLSEFREVMEQLSSSRTGVEGVVYFIETSAIPVLEQLQKKEERALKRQQRQEALLNGHQLYAAGVTRSCRVRKPVTYTFHDFDRTIEEAIKQTKKRKDREVQRIDRKHHERGTRKNRVSDGGSAKDTDTDEGSFSSIDEDVEKEQGEHTEIDEDANYAENSGNNEDQVEDSENDEDANYAGNSGKNEDQVEDSENDEDANYTGNSGKHEEEKNDVSGSSDLEIENDKPGRASHELLEGQSDQDAAGLHLKNSSGGSSGDHLQEARNRGAKNRMKQRPTRNTAIESVVPDSESGSSSENVSLGEQGEGDPSMVADSEDEIGS